MAIKKVMQTPSGVDVEYWKLVSATLDIQSKTMCVVLEGYLTQAAKQAGKGPVTTISFTFERDKFTFDPNSTEKVFVTLYNQVKQEIQFQGGLDV